jgi:O-antigen ligase
MMRQTDTGFLLDATQPATLPKKVVYVLIRARTSPQIVRWAFLLFVFTFPFEPIDLSAIRGVASLARLAGLLFFSTCLFYSRSCFRRPVSALRWFIGYVVIYGLRGLFIPEMFVGQFMTGLQTFIQLLVLCWISSTLLQEEKFTRQTVHTLAIATLLVATGMLLGLPGFSIHWIGERLTATGFNPNGLAVMLALGVQALIGLGIDQTRRNIWMRVTYMAMALLPLTAMVYTGSRGGMTAFAIGVALYALPYRESKRKMIAILGVAIAVVGIIYAVVGNDSSLLRWKRTYETGNMAGRETIFAAAVDMIIEKPLLGWGPIACQYELGPRVGQSYRDVHNLYLHLLIEGGLFGAMPFLIGLSLCVRAAWTARVCRLGLLPLVWLVTMLVANMSGTWLTAKLLWFVLIVSLASGVSTAKQYKGKNFLRTINTFLPLQDVSYGHASQPGGSPAAVSSGRSRY